MKARWILQPSKPAMRHPIKVETAALTVQAKAERTLENVAKEKKKSCSRRVSRSSSPEPASRSRRDEDDREEHAMFLSANLIRDANAAATSGSGAACHDE